MYKVDVLLELEQFCITNFGCYGVSTASSNIRDKTLKIKHSKDNIIKKHLNPISRGVAKKDIDVCCKDQISCQSASLV